MAGLLDEILQAFGALSPEEQAEIEREALAATADRVWVPNPGPQTSAVTSQADELFYGGQAGGGKSDLICGLSLTEHEVSLLLRRTNADTIALEDRIASIRGTRDGLNGQKHIFRIPGKVVEIGGCQYENDKQKFKGRPHDLIGFDEIADFSESQYRFIIAWNRSATPGQRSRVVCTGNPPTTPEGFWVLKYWGAWLDPTHPRPAKDGELRWYTTIDDHDVECEGPGMVEVNGEMIQPRSRTFIRSRLSDNPDLQESGYDSTLAALPAELRAAYREGKFDAVRADKPFQLFPTEHVRAAMDRWEPNGRILAPMTCLSHDVALGGVNADGNAYSRRHGLWFDEVIKEVSKVKLDPIELAARDMALMRDGCDVVIDMGGGFGSGVYSHLKQNVKGIKLHSHNGSDGSMRRTRDGKLKFSNKRSEVHWRLREALEPGLGVPIQLPPDPELLADLTCLTWKLGPRGIQVIDKNIVRADLGRSPDKGDCVVNAWSYGEPAIETQWKLNAARMGGGGPRVILGHAAAKRRRH